MCALDVREEADGPDFGRKKSVSICLSFLKKSLEILEISCLCLECKRFSNLRMETRHCSSRLWEHFLHFCTFFASFALHTFGSRASTMMYKADHHAFSRFDSSFFAQMLSD
jgi:hypothetical protein